MNFILGIRQYGPFLVDIDFSQDAPEILSVQPGVTCGGTGTKWGDDLLGFLSDNAEADLIEAAIKELKRQKQEDDVNG